jgi:hypothetical protein
MKFNKLYLIIPMFFLISSCAALIVGGVVGVGAVFYEKGQLTAHEGTGYDETLAAVLKAMDQLGYAVEKTEKSVAKEKVIAVTPDGKKIHITVRYKQIDHTEITIRAGTYGNEELSRKILDQIKSNLYQNI